MWIYDKKEKIEQMPKRYIDLGHLPKIQGPALDGLQGKALQELASCFASMGFQGSQLARGIEIVQEMRTDATIFLAMSGNMSSSGNRDIITYLVRHKLIGGIVTTAAGIEEDIIKCIKEFRLGTFDVKGEYLHEHLIGRIGNIYVPADRYLYFERFMNEAFPLIHEQGKKSNGIAPHAMISIMGACVDKSELTAEHKEESFVYWAWKNDIPIFCPAITDGTIGDLTVFFKHNNPSFAIDATKDNQALTKMLMNLETPKAGALILGGGAAKHFLLNASIFREGFDYCVYITTAQGFDGSDSGGNQEEAISWAKVRTNAHRVIISCDATIAFPILAAGAFVKAAGIGAVKKSKK